MEKEIRRGDLVGTMYGVVDNHKKADERPRELIPAQLKTSES